MWNIISGYEVIGYMIDDETKLLKVAAKKTKCTLYFIIYIYCNTSFTLLYILRQREKLIDQI